MSLHWTKKIFSLVLSAFLLAFAIPSRVEASNFPVEVVVFVREGCQHCADEKKFLADLVQRNDNVDIVYLDLAEDQNRAKWTEFTERTKTSKVTPITIVGESLIVGFGTADTTGVEIEKAVTKAQQTQQATVLEDITAENKTGNVASTCDDNEPCKVPEKEPTWVALPFGGKLDVSKYPLLILSSVLGFIDGFNPCAMWVLITFLIILLKVGSRRKMILFAGIFILAETMMYYAILLVWFQTWDFIRLDAIVTPLIGLVAIGGGLFFLYSARKAGVECHITDLEQRQKTRQKLQQLVTQNFTLLTFLGILGIAFSVNIIEFACSIGIPQTFTKILEMNNLSWWQTQLFVLTYILFYMIDDFIVFGIALYAFDKLSLSTKYVKISNVVGGILMIILGVIMIFNPSLLVL